MIPEIDIILVNYKQVRLTIDCVDSIKKSTYKNIKIIIVDNCSTDGSFEKLTKKYAADQSIIVLCSTENNGFSAGNNIGIKYAMENTANYIMLLNNDTVIACDMVEKLFGLTDDNTITTPKMYYHNDQDMIWYAGGEYNQFTGKVTHYGLNKPDSNKYRENRKVNFASGCCILMSRRIIERIGILSEDYFMYGEDLDYSLRIKDNDVSILYVCAAKLWHKVGSSSVDSKLNIYYDTRNRFIVFHKYNFCATARFVFFVKILFLYIRGIIFNTNERYFIPAFIDYRRGIKGKIDLKTLDK